MLMENNLSLCMMFRLFMNDNIFRDILLGFIFNFLNLKVEI